MAQRTIYVAVQHKGLHMDADNQASAEAVDTAEAVVEPAKAETPVRKPAAKARRKAKTTRKLVRANERNEEMTKQNDKIFGAFAAFPAAPAFEKLFTEASARGEEAVKRSRKAAEELANLCRGNLDALVESGKIAATGTQSIGQELVSKSRDSLEQTANTVRSFTEAKSPTELLQLHSDFARTAFDRFVEESSALTESMVKLAGEAFQPLSNRASANVEKLNQIAA
jgi:phasin family protein